MDFRTSPCPRFAKETFVGSFIREYARKVLRMTEDAARAFWEINKEKILKAIAIVDHRLIISKDKDNFEKELTALAKKDKTTVAVLTLLGSINTSFHNLHYHLRTGGQLKNVVFSTSVWKFACGRCGPMETMYTYLVGYLAHPECWLAGYISNPLQYTEELLRYFECVAAIGLSSILFYVLGISSLASS